MKTRKTYKNPSMKMLVTPNFLRIGIRSFQMIGTGIYMITKSVKTSIAMKTAFRSTVLAHWPKKKEMGAQFQSQCVPHWKIVAKKNETDQAMMKPITIQQKMAKSLTWPKSRFQRKRTDSLISPRVIFSVD